MKKIFIALVCTILVSFCGCNSKAQKQNDSTTLNNVVIEYNDETDKKIENFTESMQKLYPEIITIGLNLYSQHPYTNICINYEGDQEATMKKMIAILSSAEEFLKTQKVEKVNFSSMNNASDMGYINLELKDNKYEIVDATLK